MDGAIHGPQQSSIEVDRGNPVRNRCVVHSQWVCTSCASQQARSCKIKLGKTITMRSLVGPVRCRELAQQKFQHSVSVRKCGIAPPR